MRINELFDVASRERWGPAVTQKHRETIGLLYNTTGNGGKNTIKSHIHRCIIFLLTPMNSAGHYRNTVTVQRTATAHSPCSVTEIL